MTAFESLAAIIERIRPQGYEYASMHAELDDGWASIDLRFRSESGDELMSQLPDGSGFDIHHILDEIREEMAQTSGQHWKSCHFELSPGRHFRFDVTYPK
jgi:hypothetical protein